MRVLTGAAALALVGVFTMTQIEVPPPAPGQPPSPGRTAPDVDTARVEEHLEALQDIADANGGTRSAGTSGYVASLDYVVGVLEELGYQPVVQEFGFTADDGSDHITSWNVFAEKPSGDPGNVVMAGAHLDSIPGGPGIDDNGTGVAALLLAAEELSTRKVVNKVRFAWWGAEELGLKGSSHYVEDLAAARPDELDAIAMYLNFDMIGSSNHVRLVYDGDNSTFPEGSDSLRGPDGSGAIERVFHDFFASRSLSSGQAPLDGRSDYRAFVAEGVPVGGLFTGAEELKTEEEAEVFGGQPFAPYEPCYHRSCDDLDQLDIGVVGEMSAAVSHAVRTFAMRRRPLG
jgi:Peptidase family M28